MPTHNDTRERHKLSKEQRLIDKEKKQLLRVMAKHPGGFITEWVDTLGWLNSNNNVDLVKINKRLKQLEAARSRWAGDTNRASVRSGEISSYLFQLTVTCLISLYAGPPLFLKWNLTVCPTTIVLLRVLILKLTCSVG